MANKTKRDDSQYLDPVFLEYGQKVYTYDFIELLREENLKLKAQGKPSYNLVPQRGFQERVCEADADLLIIGGRKGGGKVLPNDTQIVTPFGYRRNGDLEIGSIISNPTTGGMERVIAIYEHPDHDFYELQFDDGATCECGLEHLWKVRQTGHTHKRRVLYGGGYEDDYRVWTFEMIKKWLDEQAEGMHYMHGKRGDSKKYLVIPLSEPVKFTRSWPKQERPTLNPYVLGVILGDGCITNSIKDGGYDAMITSADEDIIQEVINSGYTLRYAVSRSDNAAKNYYFQSKDISKSLTLCGLYGCSSNDKFIPEFYKWGTVKDRFGLVQGLMDTDGYIDNRGHCSYTTVSKQLAEDFQFVIRSLGGTATIKVDTNTGYRDENGNFIKCQDAYTVYIKIKDTTKLFRLPRKKERCKSFNGGISEVARRIVGYRHIGRKDGRCITVDSPGCLYMAQDFVVTHNTFIALYKALNYIFNPDVALYAFRKFEDDIKRGPWKSSLPIFRAFGIPKESYFEWAFLDGKGATMKMEHLQDLGKISDRFRGAEMAYIDIEELPEHTRDNIQIVFDLLAVNRNTAGVKSQVVATCNPVGKSNKLRQFLDWYINPETDEVIPERSGQKRYMFNWGSDISQIAWGDSWQEVYAHPKAKEKIDLLLMGAPDMKPEDMILTLQFIEGEYSDNKILQIADKKYVSRLASGGGAAVVNDMRGIWRDVESGDGLVSMDDMEYFFTNSERKDGVMRASADVALAGDFFVIWAFNGHHVCDMEAWFGAPSDEVVPFIRKFLKKNGVREDHFTYDKNGLGLWLEGHFKQSIGFNNKAAASDSRLWNNLKSEAAEKFVKGLKNHEYSIDTDILMRHLTDKKGNTFTIRDRLMEERMALKRKESNEGRFEIISKQQMKTEIGHSPDFIEGLFMVVPLFANVKKCIRKGFDNM